MEHHFDIEVAKEYGIVEAVLINHFQFWITRNKANGENFHDGSYWTYDTVKAYCEVFPYLSTKNIRTALQHLIDNRVIKTGCYNKDPHKRTLWYAFVDEEKWILQNRQMELPESANGGVKNGKCNITDNNADNNIHSVNDSKESLTSPIVETDEQFEKFWTLYDKKVQRPAAERMWKKLKVSEKDEIMRVVAAYVASTPDKQYRMNPATYLNPANRRWEDEIRFRADNAPKSNVVVV